jgi:GntP family gluconate:H+ symporter
MLIGAVSGLLLHRRHAEDDTAGWVRASLKEAAGVLAITGAGGALGAVLSALGIGRVLGEGLAALQMGLLVPFIVAAALKIAQGSSTVAMVTSAAIIAPLAGALGYGSDTGRVLLVLALGSGSMVTSHVNDSYFWVVSQGAGLPVATAYRAHTLATFAQGVVGIIVVWLLSLVLL